MDIYEASNWVRRELSSIGEGFSIAAGERHEAVNVRKVEQGGVREVDFVPRSFRIDVSFDCLKTGVRVHAFGEAKDPTEAANAAIQNGKAARKAIVGSAEASS